jgi:sigma-E factor negative regulatory protein RseC
MIEQQGRVVAVGPARATLLLGGSTGCPSCEAGKGCGAGIFGRLVGRKPLAMELNLEPDHHLPLVPGQAVRVGIPESVFLRLLVRFYLMPLLTGMAGGILGHVLAQRLGWGTAGQDLLTLLGALIFGAATLLTSRNHRTLQSKERLVQILGYADSRPDQHCGSATTGAHTE